MSTRAAIYDGNEQLTKNSAAQYYRIFHLEDFLASFATNESPNFSVIVFARKIPGNKSFLSNT